MTALISIAIPDSMFLDDDSLREKTVKVGQIARSAAIFGVERVYIYRDSSRNYDSDFDTARNIFHYAETPQYLRRRLVGKKRELEFVGLLPPLRTPHHLKDAQPKIEEIREGVTLMHNGKLVVDIGAREFAKFEFRGQEGQRVTVKMLSLSPLTVEPAQKPEGVYWGYEVRRAPSLARFLRSANFELMILTSRLGVSVDRVWNEFCGNCSRASKILVCFGSPTSGVDRMLAQDSAKVTDFKAMYLNMFPSQNVETIRLEEAILGSLSILNLAVRL